MVTVAVKGITREGQLLVIISWTSIAGDSSALMPDGKSRRQGNPSTWMIPES